MRVLIMVYTQPRADVRYTRMAILKAIYQLNERRKPFSVPKIAKKAECGIATVYRHLDALEKSGHIAVERRERGKGQAQNRYQITREGMDVINGL